MQLHNLTPKNFSLFSSHEYANRYLTTHLRFYFWVREKFAHVLRQVKNKRVARRHQKQYTLPFADHGYRILMGNLKLNGLSRAYLYEIERLNAHGLINPNSRNVLILGQPRQYSKIFRNANVDLSESYRIGLWVTEFEVMPPDWSFALKIVNEIWTPSEFSAKAFKYTGLPITIVPHSVRVERGAKLELATFGINENSFVGMAIMDLGTCPDRKNPLAHIDAWNLAFGDDPNAILLMKVRFGKRTQFVKQKLIEHIGASINIKLVETEFDASSMSEFQQLADVYLSLHRSEGYGLNIHEMLELGIPTVATGYSGNMTYMKKYAHGIPIPYRLAPYRDDTFHYRGPNLSWAEVNLPIAVEQLKKIRGAKHNGA